MDTKTLASMTINRLHEKGIDYGASTLARLVIETAEEIKRESMPQQAVPEQVISEIVEDVERGLLIDSGGLLFLRRALEIALGRCREIVGEAGALCEEEKIGVARKARGILEKEGFFTGGGGCTLQPVEILSVCSAFERAKKEKAKDGFEKLERAERAVRMRPELSEEDKKRVDRCPIGPYG